MRPYFAIIFDSLREALHSRVLWVLIVGVTFVLVALAPLGYRTELTTHFLTNGDFYDAQQLATELRAGIGITPSPARAVWDSLDTGQRTTITELANERPENLFRQVGGLRRVLNDVIDGEVLHNEKDWGDRPVLPEAEPLLENKAGLTEVEKQRLNRLLLEGAFPEHFRVRPKETVTVTYAGLEFPRTWLPESQLQTVIENLVLPIVTNLLLGVVAVLIALLVTSPIIPEMFAPGSLHLLLSKPISRSLVFLSRFFGGCFFVLINVSYLLIGLWLILGWRFGIWNDGLLKCIPLFLFLFIVYYSVAALAGAYWRNAVVAVGVAAGLWGVCFLLGLAREAMEGSARRASLRRIVVTDDTLLGLAENNEVAVWSEEDQSWEEVFEGGRIIHGPLLSPQEPAIVATSGGGRGPRFVRQMQQLNLQVGRSNKGWSRESLGTTPKQTAGIMFDTDGNLYAVSGEGIHRYNRELTAKQGGLFGFQLPIPGLGAMAWKRVVAAPETGFWQPPLAAGVDQSNGFVVYHRGVVTRFDPSTAGVSRSPEKLGDEAEDAENEDAENEDAENEDADKTKAEDYIQTAQVDLVKQLNVAPDEGVALEATKLHVVIALGDGRVILLDRMTLQQQEVLRPTRFSHPRSLAVSPDGDWFAVLLHNGQVKVSHQGQPLKAVDAPRATSVLLTDESLWVGSDNRALTELSLDAFAVRTEIRPPLNNLQRVNRWLVKPLTTVLPMPMDLGETASFLLSGKETTNGGLFRGTLDAPMEDIDPWTPVIRCSIFVVVMLSLGCWYIERQEF